jgi:hypothetical protein
MTAQAATETFGHEPFEYDGVPICRCYVNVTRCSIDAFEQPRPVRAREPVFWPCTSAVVLGLVDRAFGGHVVTIGTRPTGQ